MKYLTAGIFLLAFSLSACDNNQTAEERGDNNVEEVAPGQENNYQTANNDSLVIKVDESVEKLESDIEKTEREVENLLKDVE